MSKTRFSISAVHRMTGKARSTISKHIETRKISVVKDDDGNRLIDASEIIRVYGDCIELDEDGNIKTKAGRTGKKKPSNEPQENPIWKELLEDERRERKREREQLNETINHLRKQLASADDREKHHRLLLADKSKDRDHRQQQSDLWKAQLEKLEDRIANQEDTAKKIRNAILEKRKKTWWQKLWK